MSKWELRFRFLAIRAVVLGTFLAFAFQLWQLQIVRRQEFQKRADEQRFEFEAIDASRGVIYDRTGRLLVSNVPKYVISVVAARLPEQDQARLPIMERLSSLLGIPVSQQAASALVSLKAPSTVAPMDLESMFKAAGERPLEPYPLATNVERQLAFMVLEESPQLPGIVVQVQPTRQYLDGPLFSHIIGYMWRMPAEQVNDYTSLPHSDYTANDLIGSTGLERTMEAELHGHRGRKLIEVDVFGREVNLLDTEPPQAGHSLVLALDRDLQSQTEQYLRQGMAAAKSPSGVAIVMSTRTGEVLAMVSLPTYDNNLFAQGNAESVDALNKDPNLPTLNRAIAGQYPPGSTFKIIPASAGLQEKIIDRNTTLRCEGTMKLEGTTDQWLFYCWIHKSGTGHGNVNIIQALAQSCDIYFYQEAGGYKGFEGLGLDTLNLYARMYGLGEPTGIELSSEASGLVPSAKWKRLNYNESWTTGDTYNAAIGQGYVLATPLQMVNALAALANGGTLYRPQVIHHIVDANGNDVQPFKPQVIRQLDISDSTLAIVRQGLRLGVTGGTAPLANLPEVAVAGKTGSAEFGTPNEKGELPTHAWFMAYAPYEDPEVAVIVFLEGGGEGSATAAPVAAQILRYYFGLPAPVAQ